MRVHCESQQFKIFADGIADIFGIDVLTDLVKEMVQREGSRQGADVHNIRLENICLVGETLRVAFSKSR